MSRRRLYRAALRDRLLFRRRVVPSGCWLWVGSKTADGYGTITVAGKVLRVHRVAYAEYVGLIPEGQLVRHTCDTPACFNPKHLCLGTDEDNVQDAIVRGRKARGASCNKSTLTERDVRSILQDTRTQRKIAEDYGLCHATVGEIQRRSIWAHVIL